MSYHNKIFQPETKLIETANGIKLTNAEDLTAKNHLKHFIDLNSILNLPFNFYFLDKNSTILHINDTAAYHALLIQKRTLLVAQWHMLHLKNMHILPFNMIKKPSIKKQL